MKENKDFTLKPVDNIPLSIKKKRKKEKKIDVEETEYLKKIGKKPKQQTMTADYIQKIYEKMENKENE